MKYSVTQIQSVLQLLNQLSVKGIENAKRIVLIEQILQDPLREEKDNGNCIKEEPKIAG